MSQVFQFSTIFSFFNTTMEYSSYPIAQKYSIQKAFKSDDLKALNFPVIPAWVSSIVLSQAFSY